MTYLKDVLENIIGTYTPNLTAEGIAQIDWVWVAGSVLLIGLVFGFFKAVRFILGVIKP